MSRSDVLDLMRTRLGLDASSLGDRVLDDACADARRILNVDSDADLYKRIRSDTSAFAKCSECFVVPESWFFRTAEQFGDLVRFARDHVNREQRPLRVLSLPCAAGEEAYSAVITLLEAGLRAEQIEVLGIDVSHVAVARAQAGAYRNNSLRGTGLTPVWMLPTQEGFCVAPAVRACARFRHGNALDPLLLHGDPEFDVVFCRNLLIYLHPDARQRVIRTVLGALRTPGLILAGQAEVLSSLSDQLQPLEGGCPLSFVRKAAVTNGAAKASRIVEQKNTTDRNFAADQKLGQTRGSSAHVATNTATTKPSERSQGLAAEPAKSSSVTQQASADANPARTAAPPAAKEHSALADAHRLADAGHTEQARESCLEWLSRHPADVDAHFLLGLLESAKGDTEAADRAFTRVLYLNRDHLDALQQRIGLAQRRGAHAQADELRARATRLRSRQPSQS